MPKFVVYEVWTRSSIVEADDIAAAYLKGEPNPFPGYDLCNWHAVEIPGLEEYPAPMNSLDKAGQQA